jgi:FtsZ-interacting cell division protein ZipA
MSALTWILIVVGAVAVVLLLFVLFRRQRSSRLRQDFGPEYERTVRQEGLRSGEAELRERAQRRQRLEIRSLSDEARTRYSESWRLLQERFVDHPVQSVRDADQLVQQVMRDRGYPTDDFEQRAADLSVDHAEFVVDYRAAHETAGLAEGGDATTEDLREAMLRYRRLFNGLLEEESAR